MRLHTIRVPVYHWHMAHKKLVTLKEVSAIAARARKSGKRVVTTNGCFDILHIGHARNLAYARSLGDMLIVGINSDASVRRLKGRGRPLVPARERAEMLAALEAVDYVFVFAGATPVPWILRIRPDIHVKGGDRALAPQHAGRARGRLLESDAVEEAGGRVALFPHTGHSTSALVRKLRRR